MVENLPIALVRPDPNQPRKEFKEEKIRELAESIKSRGLKQPITVRPDRDSQDLLGNSNGWIVIMGERRLRAHIMAGLPTIRAIVEHEDQTVEDRLMDQLLENLQREDMNPIETAHGLRLFIEAGWTLEKTAQTMGYSPETVERKLSLCALDKRIQKFVSSGQIPETVALLLTKLSSEGQFLALRKIKNRPYSQAKPIIDAILQAETQSDLFAIPTPTREQKRLVNRYSMAMLALIAFVKAAQGDDYRILASGLDDGRLGKRVVEIDLALKGLRRIKLGLETYQQSKKIRRAA